MTDPTDRDIVEYLARHFVVRNGKMPGPYGHLELWWASTDANAPADAARNPQMMLGEATNSYSLCAMGELKVLIESARKLCNERGGK